MEHLNKIKWGIVGCGNIADKFANDLSLIENAQLFAVASRDSNRASQFKNKHHAIKSYKSYEQLFLDNDIDIVYIATPHVSHVELSIQALKHNKHVLCEKPLALNYKEAIKIIETSHKVNRFFMEALWTRFNPSLIAIKKHIDDGDIGELKYINADFSFKTDKSNQSRVLDLNLGGGAILDIGIYPAFLSYVILGIPIDILAKSIFNALTHCDMQTSMIFQYKTAQAILYAGFVSQANNNACFSGTQGQIYLHSPTHVSQGYTIVKNNKAKKIKLPTKGIGLSHEIIECHKCILHNKIESKLWSHQNSLDLITILDKVRNQVGLIYPQERES